jgi:hypothetical protein
MVVEPGDGQLSEIWVLTGMVGGELGAVISGATGSQQHRRTRVVEMPVMQNRQARIAKEIGPDVVVMGRVADLVDD